MGTRHGGEKWGRQPFGEGGGTVTWSLTALTDRFSRVDAVIAEGRFAELVRDAIDAWGDVLDLRFREVGRFQSADIEIGWGDLDGRGGFLGVAFTQFAGDRLTRSAVLMDEGDRWSTDPDAVPRRFRDPENFYAVVLHEIGHAIGLDHRRDPNTLMHRFTSDVTDLTLKDVRAAVALYGPNPRDAGPGAQILAGTSDADRLSAGGGPDRLHGFAGADTLLGGPGPDRAAGGPGADLIVGGGRNDRLNGEGADDRLIGGRGHDRLDGGGGDDALDGGRGGDRLKGRQGDDRLDGGRGSDRMQGDAGADVFVLSRGRDLVRDFRPGTDAVAVTDGPGRFAALEIEDRGRGAAVIGDGGVMILAGVARDDLTADDFLFG